MWKIFCVVPKQICFLFVSQPKLPFLHVSFSGAARTQTSKTLTREYKLAIQCLSAMLQWFLYINSPRCRGKKKNSKEKCWSCRRAFVPQDQHRMGMMSTKASMGYARCVQASNTIRASALAGAARYVTYRSPAGFSCVVSSSVSLLFPHVAALKMGHFNFFRPPNRALPPPPTTTTTKNSVSSVLNHSEHIRGQEQTWTDRG